MQPPIPENEQPRERCLAHGADTLSLRECIALLLHTGSAGVSSLRLASRVLNACGPDLPHTDQERAFFTAMERGFTNTWPGMEGLGAAGRARLLAAVEVGRRYAIYRARRKVPAGSLPQDNRIIEEALCRIPDSLRGASREWMGFVPLHRSAEVGELCVVEYGVRTHVNIDPAEFFARVLATRPKGFFLFHNHPSGDTTPSQLDHDLTRRISLLASHLGVRLLGHGIVAIGENAWVES